MGDDIAIDKEKKPPKPLTGKAVYPCTVAFLYTKLKPTMELLTDNGATDITSWDYSNILLMSPNVTGLGFRQRFDDFGDYETAADAISNNLKESRKNRPGTGGGRGGDDEAWPSKSADAVTAWWYIGDPDDIVEEANIFYVTGTPLHPFAGNVTTSGPGICMEVATNGSISSAIFPSYDVGSEPLTKYLKTQYPDLGGKIGYAGDISIWRGLQDFENSNFSYVRGTPSINETVQTPTSSPSWWNSSTMGSPWSNATGSNFFQFGWHPMYAGCASSSWINVEKSAIEDLACGGKVAGTQWYWGGSSSASPTRGIVNKNVVNGYIGVQGMFICWQGHKDHLGMFEGFLEQFKDYWLIGNNVPETTIRRLGTANPYGCGGGGGGDGGPYPEPVAKERVLINSYGRKGEVWLKVCRQEDAPLEIKLPFEYVALVEEIRTLGGQFLGNPDDLNSGRGNRINQIEFLGGSYGFSTGGSCEVIHATLNIDEKGEFAYVDILYGVEREYESPLSKAIPSLLSDAGSGNFNNSVYASSTSMRTPAVNSSFWFVEGEWIQEGRKEVMPRIKKDSFSYCQSYKIKLPTKSDKTLSITAQTKYKRPATITLSVGTPDNEFNQKYLVCDFRTNRWEDIPSPVGASILRAPWQNPQPYFASFGGLPCLIQGVGKPGHGSIYNDEYMFTQAEFYYKSLEDWTELDHIYFELMEKPRRTWGNSGFPTGVFNDGFYDGGNIEFVLDGKFQRQGRAERLIIPSPFGYNGSGGIRQYGGSTGFGEMGLGEYNFPLAIEFKEQLIGNGIIKDGVLTKWFRITSSSLPLFGQKKRNPAF